MLTSRLSEYHIYSYMIESGAEGKREKTDEREREREVTSCE